MTRQDRQQPTGHEDLAAAAVTAALTAVLARPEVLARLADAILARRARTAPRVPSQARVLDLGAARAQMKAASGAARPPGRPGGTSRPIALHAVRTVAQRPEAPPYALHSVAADGSWRWAAADVAVPSAPEWESLAAGLVAQGPFRSLHITAGDLTTADAMTQFQHDRQGAEWVTVVVDRRLPAHRARRALAHELAHIADETARVGLVASIDTWRSTFTHPHRTAQAEAFAWQAEEWVEPQTRAADLIEAARRHQQQRGTRR
nr:hypothetical protein [Streptomyces chartreusis]